MMMNRKQRRHAAALARQQGAKMSLPKQASLDELMAEYSQMASKAHDFSQAELSLRLQLINLSNRIEALKQEALKQEQQDEPIQAQSQDAPPSDPSGAGAAGSGLPPR